jgi:hypothetical protein
LFDTTLSAALLVLSALMALAAIPFRLTLRSPNAFVPKQLSQAPCHFRTVILPGFSGFSHSSEGPARPAEFAAPAGPARLFMLWPWGAPPKIQQKRGTASGPSLAMGLADHYRKCHQCEHQRHPRLLLPIIMRR